jgi:2-polyprenyl-3-methyl-5-hydroxy-6-metoxy-1,4-benzoquinol methylase
MDKAGMKFWGEFWERRVMPKAVNPRERNPKNWVNRRFHEWFTKLFGGHCSADKKLLEIGCGNSAWLPYFSREFGFKVSGIDYSPVGCQMARQILKASRVEAEVICCDLFSPPKNMVGGFDVVMSFGLIEHFEDTASVLRAASAFLKPEGMLISNIPNMIGLIGSLQKILNKPVYDVHKLLDADMLRMMHERAGLEVIDCDYFLASHFGVCALDGIPLNTYRGFSKKVLVGLLARISMAIAMMEERVGKFPATRFASPYVNCVARKSL